MGQQEFRFKTYGFGVLGGRICEAKKPSYNGRYLFDFKNPLIFLTRSDYGGGEAQYLIPRLKSS